MKYYLGFKFNLKDREVFTSDIQPTLETHGDKYGAVTGPFKTKRAAEYMRDNPMCMTVGEAEDKSNWTAEKVRQELPDVKIVYNNNTHMGYVRGRRNIFASVFFYANGHPLECECSWETIANCLNNSKPIRY